MLKEIGSNFFEYSLYNNNLSEKIWWQKDEFYKQYFKSGRNAIKAFCQLFNHSKRKVLLPAYTCETVVQPFMDENWEIQYYEINKDLSINIESIRNILKNFECDVLYCQSYFGFPTHLNAKSFFTELKKQGIVIVEDITQSVLTENRLEIADYYIASLRKFLAIPDGGVLIAHKKIQELKVLDADINITDVALNAFKLKETYFRKGNIELKEEFRSRYVELNKLISVNDGLYAISPISYKIFNSADYKWIVNCRFLNYKYLFENLSDLEFLTPILELKNESEVPLFFPLYLSDKVDRKEFQGYMAEDSIYCPIIWPIPSGLDLHSETSEYIYKHIICIPIDQRYDMNDMSRVVEKIRKYQIEIGEE